MNTGGFNRNEKIRGFERTRNWYLGCCAVLTIAIGVLVVYIVTSFADEMASSERSDYIVVLVVSFVLLAVPAGYTAARTVRWNRWIRDSASWLPPTPPVTVSGDLDLVAQIRRLRVPAWRTFGLAVVFLALFVAGVVISNDQDDDAQQLLDHGVRVSGRVFDEKVYSKSAWSISVTYPAGGTWRIADIVLGTKRHFDRGQEVTVIYDPADPGRVRTPEDANTTDQQEALVAVPILIGLPGFPFAAVGAFGWFRRYRAVRRTGWHAASVLALRGDFVRATYYQGGELLMKGGLSLRQPKRFAQSVQQRRVWLGGEESAMVMLFPGQRGAAPRAVAARATAPLTPPRPVARTRRVSRRKPAARPPEGVR